MRNNTFLPLLHFMIILLFECQNQKGWAEKSYANKIILQIIYW